ncbi:hypothetical protein [Arthrobacter tecti]
MADESYTWYQRLLLYFSTTKRKVSAVVVAVAIVLGLVYFDFGSHLFTYVIVGVLAVLFTQGALLRRPTKLPPDIMLDHATKRFTKNQSWPSPKDKTEALESLQEAFTQPGVTTRTFNDSLWIEMDKDWDPGKKLRHAEVAKHLKILPPAHFFVASDGAGSTITAYSHDNRLVGMWDVMQLSDEMADAAVELAKDATS